MWQSFLYFLGSVGSCLEAMIYVANSLGRRVHARQSLGRRVHARQKNYIITETVIFSEVMREDETKQSYL
jgi:hypothetical protein